MRDQLTFSLEDEIDYLVASLGLKEVDYSHSKFDFGAILPAREWEGFTDVNPLPGLLSSRWIVAEDGTYGRIAYGTARLVVEWDGACVTLTLEYAHDRRQTPR